MNFLWAPWRNKYVSDNSKKKDKKCIFCTFLNESNDTENLIVYREKTAYVILNRFPYNPGHIMIVPNRHIPSLELLSDEESLEMLKLVKKSMSILRKIYSPDGFNIGINIGRVAGAGIEEHVHVHIVPRWNGDANFMPVLANTKVLPESLDDTYNKLRKYFQNNEETFDR
ncbi:HIT domain-containing protein [Acidianus sp. RZ1]|uniref:HIT family hydrolase n=1 Tax=Candidatus Acidianus copahuensis TaxID=1160895 RepID=A0A031LNE6_9CREN|nr:MULTISPECIES: HIT domain-containing protein [Acidianus]EZQ03064.1 HIT family hydrolase [Candidatus Acidianus copahuensis]NON62284.1 HIT domain-containing protein [Acidianus sp. RZ1]